MLHHEEKESIMAPYESHGFIGKEIATWIDAKRRVHNELFQEAEKLNADCYQALRSVRINKDNFRQTLVGCLFPRCMELFQATYILVVRGMSPSANIMLRSLIETMFVLCAVAKNDDALRAYIVDNEELERQRNANNIVSRRGTAFSDIPLADIEQIETELERINDQKIKKFTTKDF